MCAKTNMLLLEAAVEIPQKIFLILVNIIYVICTHTHIHGDHLVSFGKKCGNCKTEQH